MNQTLREKNDIDFWTSVYEMYQAGMKKEANALAIERLNFVIRGLVSKRTDLFCSRTNVAAEQEDLEQSMYCIICDKMRTYQPYPNNDDSFVSGTTYFYPYLAQASADYARGGDGMCTGASKYEVKKMGYSRLNGKSLEEAMLSEEPDNEVSRALANNAQQSAEASYFDNYVHPELVELANRTKDNPPVERQRQFSLLQSLLSLETGEHVEKRQRKTGAPRKKITITIEEVEPDNALQDLKD